MLTGMEMKNCFVFTKCSQAIIVGWVSLARCQKVLSHCALHKERLKDILDDRRSSYNSSSSGIVLSL